MSQHIYPKVRLCRLKELHFRLYLPQQARQVLKLIETELDVDWTGMAGLKSLFPLKEKKNMDLKFQIASRWTVRLIGHYFICTANWCLVTMHNAMFGEQHKH